MLMPAVYAHKAFREINLILSGERQECTLYMKTQVRKKIKEDFLKVRRVYLTFTIKYLTYSLHSNFMVFRCFHHLF